MDDEIKKSIRDRIKETDKLINKQDNQDIINILKETRDNIEIELRLFSEVEDAKSEVEKAEKILLEKQILEKECKLKTALLGIKLYTTYLWEIK